MKFPPFVFTCAAGAAALAGSQICVPTAKAQPIRTPAYRVQVEWQKAERGVSGLVVRGRIRNTGRQALVYTQVSAALLDGQGKTVYEAGGYLTVSPLSPGQSAEVRACVADAPAFRRVQVTLREAGQPVMVEETAPAR